ERVVQWVHDGMPLPNGRGTARDHHEAMPFAELPAFMRELREVKTIPARALEFTILTVARTSEVPEGHLGRNRPKGQGLVHPRPAHEGQQAASRSTCRSRPANSQRFAPRRLWICISW